MFYAIENELIPMHGFKISHCVEDIEKLNKSALTHDLEVTAISAHALKVLDDYSVLSSGGSFGINYGPIIVSKSNSLDNLTSGLIGIPGYLTSAYLLMTLAFGKLKCKEILFSEIPESLNRNDIDYGLVIHESQLTFQSQNLNRLFDLGNWWHNKTNGLPVPLGINVASKRLLKIDRIRDFDILLKNSIIYSLEHLDEAIDFASKYGRGTEKTILTKFVKMYVNDYTVDMKQEGKNSLITLFNLARDKGILDKEIQIHFA
jgi:1,4-dihydroxy-6-naphthoate synthase